MSLEFSHDWSYRGLGRPVMVVDFRSRGPAPRSELVGQTWAMVVVDSGSEVTILPKRLAKPLRVSLDDRAVEAVSGAGGVPVPCYPDVELEARLCGEWTRLPVRFFATEDRKGGLLGTAGAFEALRLTFDHSRERLYAARVDRLVGLG